MSSFAPGNVIDGYEVLGLLGQGGMGAVYKVRRGDTLYALKTLEGGLSPEDVARFRREGELLAALRHSSIVPVHAAGQAGRTFYFVMGLIEGESLDDRIRRQGKLPLHEAGQILLEVADAMAFAHERGVVHRDLKPANIMLERDTDRVLIADFGVARQLADRDERLTRTGEVIGTPSFLSPEQALGLKEELDARTDVYGLGAILYTALSGRPPFQGSNALVVLQKVATAASDPLGDDVPEQVAQLVKRCLAKNRVSRPASAASFARDLEAALLADAARRRLPRWLLVGAPAVAIACVLAVGAYLLAFQRIAQARRVEAARLEKAIASLDSGVASPLPAEDFPRARTRVRGTYELALVSPETLRRAASERTTRGEQALASGAFAEALAAFEQAWVLAPDVSDPSFEGALVAATLALAAERRSADRSTTVADALERRIAPPRGLPEAFARLKAARASAVRLLIVSAKARTARLVEARARDRAAWRRVALLLDAAGRGDDNAPRDSAVLAAATLLAGQPDRRLLALVRREDLAQPVVAFASETSYREALAVEDAIARVTSLDALHPLPPPEELRARLAHTWLECAREKGHALAQQITERATSIGRPNSNLTHEECEALLRNFPAATFFARACALDPSIDPFPEELTPVSLAIRLLTKNKVSLDTDELRRLWGEIARNFSENHPIALVIQARVVYSAFDWEITTPWTAEERLPVLEVLAKAAQAIRPYAARREARALAYMLLAHSSVDLWAARCALGLEVATALATVAHYRPGWDQLLGMAELAQTHNQLGTFENRAPTTPARFAEIRALCRQKRDEPDALSPSYEE